MNGRSRELIRYRLVFVLLFLLFGFAIVKSINTGSVNISLGNISRIILLRDTSNITDFNIIWKIRLPRLLTAAVLGGALSLSGFLLQTFFRNPVAGPFILGIASGAKMFLAVVTIAFTGWFSTMPVSITVTAAFVGSMLSMLLVLLFSGRIKNMSMLLIIGIMISNICSSVTDFLINFAKEAEIVNLTYWSMGSFSASSWADLWVCACIVLPTVIAAFFLSKPMSVYALGEGYAKSMGVNIGVFRVVLITLSSVLSAAVTAFAGPISFVGIAVPHISRMMLKTTKPHLMIPTTFLCGAVFSMLCDLVARTLFSPTELSIGTVTGAIGAPIVIWLMLSRGGKNNDS